MRTAEKARSSFPPKYAFSSVLDNYFLDHTPSKSYFSGQFKGIPLMVGNTAGCTHLGGRDPPTNFAKSGNPSEDDVPQWDPYTKEKPVNMHFGETSRCELIEESPLRKFVKDAILEI